MTVTIYIDLLICINLIVNYFLLALSFKYVKCNIKTLALLRGAIVGAVLSLTILLPPLPLYLSIPLKLAVGMITVFSASLKKPIKIFLKLFSVFILVTFALCGIVYFLYMTFLPQMFYVRNGTVYADISPIMLIVSTAVCYAVIEVSERITGKALPKSFYCNVSFDIDGKDYNVFGKIDSGNSLREPFSQNPVIIINSEAISLTQKDTETRNDIRIIPFNSVGGKGVLMGIKAKNLKINKRKVLCDVYIAPCDNAITVSGIDALLSCELCDYLNDDNILKPKKKEREKAYEIDR